MNPDLSGALATLDDWPVDHVGAGVVGGGEPAVAGEVDRGFELASVTKVLVAVAVLVAVEEEVLDLDEPAGPDGSTVRHLLAHASGLGPEQDDGTLAPPGTRRIYSNAGFELLGQRLAERSGTTCAAYLHEAVLAPLGMAGTALEGSPAHGAHSTVSDLVELCAELLEPSRVLHPDTVAEATTPAFADLGGVLPGYGRQDPNPWGLGFEIRGHKSPHWTPPEASPRTFGHFGQRGTMLWVDPDAGLACVALTDRDFGPWAAAAWPALGSAVLASRPR